MCSVPWGTVGLNTSGAIPELTWMSCSVTWTWFSTDWSPRWHPVKTLSCSPLSSTLSRAPFGSASSSRNYATWCGGWARRDCASWCRTPATCCESNRMTYRSTPLACECWLHPRRHCATHAAPGRAASSIASSAPPRFNSVPKAQRLRSRVGQRAEIDEYAVTPPTLRRSC